MASTTKSDQNKLLDERTLTQIEIMYSSKGTHVTVCGCPANLYLNKARNSAINGGGGGGASVGLGIGEQWDLLATGVPVILYDSGESRSRRTKKLKLVLADLSSGFVVWSQDVGELNHYRRIASTFHTFFNTDPTIICGFRFDESSAADKFYKSVKDFENELIKNRRENNSSFKKTKKSTGKNPHYAKNPQDNNSNSSGNANANVSAVLKKSDISNPILFTHISSVKVENSEYVVKSSTGATSGILYKF